MHFFFLFSFPFAVLFKLTLENIIFQLSTIEPYLLSKKSFLRTRNCSVCCVGVGKGLNALEEDIGVSFLVN